MLTENEFSNLIRLLSHWFPLLPLCNVQKSLHSTQVFQSQSLSPAFEFPWHFFLFFTSLVHKDPGPSMRTSGGSVGSGATQS